MVGVTELDRLFDVHVLIGVVARPVEERERRPETADDKQDCENAEAGVDVGSAMEQLTHRRPRRRDRRTRFTLSDPISLLELAPLHNWIRGGRARDGPASR